MYYFFGFVALCVVAFWVNSDAIKLDVEQGSLRGGLFDMSASQWGFAIFLNALVAVPAYLLYRPMYKKIQKDRQATQVAESAKEKAHGSVEKHTKAREHANLVSAGVDPAYDATVDALERYETLHNEGALSEQEYKELKAAVLVKFAFSPCESAKA